MKLLIAYDGFECADAAIEDLRSAGLPKTAEAIVMSHADVFLPPPIMKKQKGGERIAFRGREGHARNRQPAPWERLLGSLRTRALLGGSGPRTRELGVMNFTQCELRALLLP